jgi:transposase
MALEGYKSNHNVVYSSKYHCVWTPKYRRSVLVGPIAKRCEPVMRQTAESFAVASDGEIVDNPRWFRTAQKKLRVVQRHVSRCSQRSGGWRKACMLVAQLHRQVFHQRNDFQHKLSRELVNHHGFIAVEDLHGKGLAGGMLAKSVQDAGVVKLHRKVVL